jgi:putative endonuclease
MPWVYLLRCADDSIYCGWTTDLRRRLAEHGRGTASRYTRSRRPVALAYAVAVADRSAALRAEARIKRLPRAGKLELIVAEGSVEALGLACFDERRVSARRRLDDLR